MSKAPMPPPVDPSFAVIADIHGNALALQAVLDDMFALGVTQAVNLGDIFSGPLDPAGTAALLSERDFPTVRGNHDRYLIDVDPSDLGPSDRYAHDRLDQSDLDWIAKLPASCTPFEGVFMCHGTPHDDNQYWLDRVMPDGSVRPATLAEVEAAASGIDADLILCAHTHLPRVLRLSDGRTIMNPGSVGCPGYDDSAPVYHHMQTGTPDASYAVVTGRPGHWTISHRSLPYPHKQASAQAAAAKRPDWARVLATGWFTA